MEPEKLVRVEAFSMSSRWIAPFFFAWLVVTAGNHRANADSWPIRRGPSHEPVPHRYRPDDWKKAPKEFLEDAAACILYSGVTHLVEQDGTIETVTHEITRLNGRKGVEKLGEHRSISFDPGYQQACLNEARVIKADGRLVPIESRHVQLRDVATDYQVYDRDKQLVISFPNLEVGDVIEVKWTTRGKNPEHQGHFFTVYTFGDDHYPVALDEMRVRLPKSRPLRFAAAGGELKPEVHCEGNWRVYHWRGVHRPQLPQDENLPSKEELRLQVACSTFSSWEEVGRWKRHLRTDAWECTSAIREIVQEVTSGLKTPIEKARALTYWVRRHIRYVSEGEKHDYTPYAPCQVLANRFGDCKDQSQLLAVMLREAGLDVALATLGALGDGQICEDVPSPWGSHAILVVRVDGQEHWIDTTITTAAWDFLPREDRDRLTYVVDDKSVRLCRTPPLTPEANRIEQTTLISVASNGSARCRRTVTYHGLASIGQRDEWIETPPGERRRLVTTELQNAHSRARLRHLTLDRANLGNFDQPVMARIDFEVPGYFRGENDRDGSVADSLIWSKLLSVNIGYERSVALDLGVPFESTHVYSITLPPAYHLERWPKDCTVRSRWGVFTVRVVMNPEQPRQLDLAFRTRLNKVRVEPADLEEFRQFFEDVLKNYQVWLALKPTDDIVDAPLLEAVLALAPNDSASAAVLARLYQHSGRMADARRVLKRARRCNPGNAVLWELSAKVAANLQEEEAVYEEMVRRFPAEPKYAVALGEARVNRGDHAGARKVLEPVSRKGAPDWRGPALYQLARSAFAQHQPAQAFRQLESAARVNPESAASTVALRFKAQVLRELGHPADAAIALRQAVEAEPDNPEALHTLVELELEAGQRTEALDHLRRYTVAACHDLEGYVKAAGLHLRLNRLEDAFDLATRGREIGFHAGAERVLGLVYFHRKDYDRAIAHLERAEPDADTLDRLVRAYVACGRLADAERQAERIESVRSTTPELTRSYALIIALTQRRMTIEHAFKIPAAKAEQWARAIDAFVCAEHALTEGQPIAKIQQLLALAFAEGVELGSAFALRGQLALDRGRLGEALADAERAVALSPQEARGFYVRGRVRLERGASGAVGDLVRAVDLSHKKDAVILHWLASALVQSGRPRAALAAQRLAVLLRPDDADLAEFLQRLEREGQSDQ
jgi:tetratricopeptide (TPR) repeat protein